MSDVFEGTATIEAVPGTLDTIKAELALALVRNIGDARTEWPITIEYPQNPDVKSARIYADGRVEVELVKPLNFIELLFHVDTGPK